MKEREVCCLNQLQAYVEHRLSPPEQRLIESHLASCASCREQLESMQVLEEWVVRKYKTLQPTEIPDPGADVLFAQLEKENAQTQENFFQRWWKGVGWVVVASSLVLALVFFYTPFFRNMMSRESGSQEFLAKGWRAQMLYGRRIGSKTYSRAKVAEGKTILSPFDTIQFSYTLSNTYFLAILGINQQGRSFSILLCKPNVGCLRKPGAGTYPENRSLILDEYIGEERYFVVVARTNFSWKTLKQAVEKEWKAKRRRLQHLDTIPGPWLSRSWWVEKKRRR